MALENPQPRGRYYVEALGRGLALLDCFITDPGPHSLIELSRRVGLGMPTTLRLIRTLEEAGYVRQAADTRRYWLSWKMLQLQDVTASIVDYADLARPHLEELAATVGEATGMAVLDDTEVRHAIRVSSVLNTDMPAVTAPPNIALPRMTAVDPSHATLRAARAVTTSPRGFEGEGFPVRRAFAGVSMADLDPFIHLDQMGEVEYAPGEAKGTSWHPHRGFETVTYMIDGTFEHHDSNGGGGLITNGDTQWMTAGAGILHVERPPEQLVVSGGLFHGLQLWVNLPSRDKLAPPRYQDIRADKVSLLASADGGALVRVIAGEVDGHR